MNPLFIIPARGGSKGIPHKNIKALGGRPLIAYSIDCAKAFVDDAHIIVSTDSAEIAEIATNLGMPVPYRRPDALATDTAGSREFILDAMDWAESNKIDYDCVVLLQPTSPFRTIDDVRRALELYTDDIDMVVSVTPAKSNPYYNIFETDTDTGFLHISKGLGTYTRRQDAPKVWEYNGAVYVINPTSIRRYTLGEMPRRIPCPMPTERSIDLDTPNDWLVAEALMSQLKPSETNE